MASIRDEILSDPMKLACEIVNDVMAAEDEIADAIRQAIRHERSECMALALHYGGRDAEEIAELIGARNFTQR